MRIQVRVPRIFSYEQVDDVPGYRFALIILRRMPYTMETRFVRRRVYKWVSAYEYRLTVNLWLIHFKIGWFRKTNAKTKIQKEG